jgi:hypothetical protein
MNTTTSLGAVSLSLILTSTVWGQDVSHFRRAEVPANESRLSALNGVKEFRYAYELARFTPGTLLIAEVFRDGKCVDRFRLSRAKYDESKKSTTGVISIGWQSDNRKLVSVHDNGNRYSPWTASAQLADFNLMREAYYFSDSLPEKRNPDKLRSEYYDFELYPVLGLCGERSLQIAYPKDGDAQSFLKACSLAGVKDAVVVYLYFSPLDEEPAVKFTK